MVQHLSERVMMALDKKQMDGTIDAISESSELGDLIDMPVRAYSSGMRRRLSLVSAILR